MTAARSRPGKAERTAYRDAIKRIVHPIGMPDRIFPECAISDEDMQEIVMTYNLTPRKCLGYRTPLQALFSELGRDVRLHFA